MNGVLALGPVFGSIKRQEAPYRNITDLGILMSWGHPKKRHQSCLYWNGKEKHRKNSFEQVLLHEEDAPESFSYQSSDACKTAVGMFYPLTAYLREIYIRGEVNRNLFQALTELDPLLPVASKQPRHTGRLSSELEIGGFYVTTFLKLPDRVMLDVGWKAQKGNLTYFTGILEVKPFLHGFSSQWRLPGPFGVNHLLMSEFSTLCPNPADCLNPEFQQQVFDGIPPTKPAKHVKSCWNNAVLMANVGSSSTP